MIPGICTPKDQPWFSDEVKNHAMTSLTDLCIEKVIEKRDEILANNSQSGWITKGVVYLTAEAALLLFIPAALIESVFRSTISWIAYPLATSGVISNADGDFYSKALIQGSGVSTGSALKAFHALFLGLNPMRPIGNPIHGIEIHFPLFGSGLRVMAEMADDY